MKLELHWQILIGLVLGIIFGIIFPSTFKITDSTIASFEQIKKEEDRSELIRVLQSEKKEFEETETELLKRIKPALGPELY